MPGPAGVPGPPGPPGPPGDMSGALAGNYWDFVSRGGLQKGPRNYGRRHKRSVSCKLYLKVFNNNSH